MIELNSSVSSRELPVNLFRSLFSVSFPRSHLRLHGCYVENPTSKALSFQDAAFDFCHVRPAPMFWHVMDIQSFRQTPGLPGLEYFIE